MCRAGLKLRNTESRGDRKKIHYFSMRNLLYSGFSALSYVSVSTANEQKLV